MVNESKTVADGRNIATASSVQNTDQLNTGLGSRTGTDLASLFPDTALPRVPGLREDATSYSVNGVAGEMTQQAQVTALLSRVNQYFGANIPAAELDAVRAEQAQYGFASAIIKIPAIKPEDAYLARN